MQYIGDCGNLFLLFVNKEEGLSFAHVICREWGIFLPRWYDLRGNGKPPTSVWFLFLWGIFLSQVDFVGELPYCSVIPSSTRSTFFQLLDSCPVSFPGCLQPQLVPRSPESGSLISLSFLQLGSVPGYSCEIWQFCFIKPQHLLWKIILKLVSVISSVPQPNDHWPVSVRTLLEWGAQAVTICCYCFLISLAAIVFLL